MRKANTRRHRQAAGRFMAARRPADSSGAAWYLRRHHAQHLPLCLADENTERGGPRLVLQRRLDRAAG